MSHPHRRILGTLLLALAAVLAIAGPASAHVTVNPGTATQGGFAKLTFRVPTESDTASTTRLQVQFPADEPLAFVSVKPHAGWSFKVTKTKLATPIKSDDGSVTEAVSEIVWTADTPAAAIKPGEFDEFDVSAGPLPKAASMTFKAIQTYSDGTVVRWIEDRSGGAEPEHPAPVLTLTPATTATTTATTAPSRSDGSAQADDSSDGKATAALVLAILALVLGAGGLVAGLSRRRSAS